MRLIFTEDKAILSFPGETEPATYTIDPSKTPKEIDITPEDMPERKAKGIYALDGDSLKLCGAEKGDRPKEFNPDKANQLVVLTFKRDKK